MHLKTVEILTEKKNEQNLGDLENVNDVGKKNKFKVFTPHK